MYIKIIIDCWRFKVKPTQKEIPHIRKRIGCYILFECRGISKIPFKSIVINGG